MAASCLARVIDAAWTESCQHYKYQQLQAQWGMHIICIKAVPKDRTSFLVSVLQDAMEEHVFVYHKKLGDAGSIVDFLAAVETTLRGSSGEAVADTLDWGAFAEFGVRVPSVDELVFHGMLD
jgi:hypothetical protein